MSKLQTCQSTLNIRCPKDNYAFASRQIIQKSNQSKSKLSRMATSNKKLLTKRSDSNDEDITARTRVKKQPLEQIIILRRKLKNIEFLENCIYLEIDKLEAKQNNANRKKAEYNHKIYEQNVAQYQTLVENIDYFRKQVSAKQQYIQQLREGIRMVCADIQSHYSQKTELLLQKEDFEQLLAAYSQQYQQQDKLIDLEIQLEDDLKCVQQNKQEVARKLQQIELKQNQLNQFKKGTNHKFLEQKINQMRIQLFQKQEKLNNSCKVYKVKNLREIICAFYTQKKNKENSKSHQQGIEIWLCKNQLVTNFERFVKQKKIYQNKELIKNFNNYIEILVKIQNAIKRNKKNTQEESMNKIIEEEAQIMAKFNDLGYKQKNILKQKEQIKAKYDEIFSQEKRLYIQSLEGDSRNLKRVVQKVCEQQKNRIENIKNTKIRLRKIKQMLLTKVENRQNEYLIKKQENTIKYQFSCLETLKKELIKLQKSKQTLESEIQKQKSKKNNFMNKNQENIEAISILYKKIAKLQNQKKELNNQIQTHQNQMLPKQQYHQYTAYYTQNKTPSSKNIKSNHKFSNHPLEQTIKKLQNLKQSLVTDRGTVAMMMSKMVSY